MNWLLVQCSDNVHVHVIIFVNDNIGINALSQKHIGSTYALYSVTVIGKFQVLILLKFHLTPL